MQHEAMKAGLLAALVSWGCGAAAPEDLDAVEQAQIAPAPTATVTVGPGPQCPLCPQLISIVMSNVVAKAMVADANNLYVLASEGLASKIWKVPLGSITESLLWEEMPLRAFGMAQDATHLFVATTGTYDGCKVHRINKTTGTKSVVASETCWTEFVAPHSLFAAPGPGGSTRIFWGSDPLQGVFDLRRADFPNLGWVNERMIPTSDEHGFLYPAAVVADATHVYFNETFGPLLYRVHRVSHELEVFGTVNANHALAIDATHVYYDFNAGIRRLNKATGTPETFANPPGAPTFMQVTDGTLYWSSSYAGALYKKPVAGGAITVLASNLTDPGPIAIGPSYVYVGTQSSVRRYAK
jgi:hypothetical protein